MKKFSRKATLSLSILFMLIMIVIVSLFQAGIKARLLER